MIAVERIRYYEISNNPNGNNAFRRVYVCKLDRYVLIDNFLTSITHSNVFKYYSYDGYLYTRYGLYCWSHYFQRSCKRQIARKRNSTKCHSIKEIVGNHTSFEDLSAEHLAPCIYAHKRTGKTVKNIYKKKYSYNYIPDKM